MEASRNFLEFTTKASDSANALQQGDVHHRHHGKKKHVSEEGVGFLLGLQTVVMKDGVYQTSKKLEAVFC